MTWPFVFQDLVREFITLFVVIDPVGTIPVFLFATAAVPQRLHRSFALRAVLVSALVLGLFLVLWQISAELRPELCRYLGAFQIAGGIILFLFALSMIFGETKAASEIKEAENEDLSGAVFPLAIPSIASPGAILAVVILTDNHSTGVVEQAMTAVVLLFVLAITFVLLLLASKIQKLIGQTGVSVISRVMGLILATVAVDAVLQGLEQMGVLALSTPPV